ncbi:hypothetical protein AVEN_230129-1 [Araneus ventricosus]|uniref:BTB domain-containing protein n=1 Tax=Araneus ventricosus TaxID=182803 RepID=A0A4Y2IH46_ARAVE|nr:hypothetical protein AVEN_230129-1 [Araneus ventricosus]
MSAYGREVNETAHLTCIWKLENIGVTFDLYSPTLTAQAIGMTKWNLKMYCGIAGPIILLISRKDKDDGPDKIKIKFELSFLGIDGLPLIKEVGEKQFLKGDHFVFPKFADEFQVFFQRRIEFLPKGVLTIRCRMWRIGTEISKSDLYFARTLFETDRCFNDLAIEKFSTLQVGEVKKFLLNPPSSKYYKLTLQFYITEKNNEEYLCMDIKYHGIAWHNIKICLLDFEKKVVHSDEKSGTFCCSFFDFFKRNELIEDEASLLPNDVLTLRCEIEGKPKIVWNGIENYSFLNSPSLATKKGGMHFGEQDQTSAVPSSSTDVLKRLLEEGTLSDLSFRTYFRSVPAQKCILNALSPVFKAIFSRDMREKTRKCVKIPDLDEDTLREFLSYMDAVGELQWRGAADLRRAANKYELLELKRRCATFLISNLSAGSICNESRTNRNSVRFRYVTRHGILSIRFVAKRQRAKF